MNSNIIAITGGIGAGKSVVSHMLTCMGYDVYDCDSRAKELILSLPTLQKQITEQICLDAFHDDGSYNNIAVSKSVFSDLKKMNTLNKLVHNAVFADIKNWLTIHNNTNKTGQIKPIFIESAILYSSGLWKEIPFHSAWIVTAPDELRIERVIRRNGLSVKQIKERIATQTFNPSDYPLGYTWIVNDNHTPVLPQILKLISIKSDLKFSI